MQRNLVVVEQKKFHMNEIIDLTLRATKITSVEPTYLGGASSLGVKVELEDVRVDDIIESLVSMFGTEQLIKAITEDD